MNTKDTLICIVLIALTLYACANVAAVGGELRAAAAVQQELSAELEERTADNTALREKLESMGYELSDEELESVFTRFKDLADKKKNITSSDIEALVLHRQAAVQGSCQLVSHVVNTGHGVPNISCIKLQRGDEQIEDVAIGTGPLDASFKAINRMLQMDVKLESFSLNAVTDGEDAIGEAVVKVSGPDGRSYTGSGLSTDIIESSIRAYVNGINKIMESGN